MKRPSFQFYPADWLRDTALRSCSPGARGLWIDMICFMHEGNPYGHLKVGNKVILPPNLASMVGATLPDVVGWLDELNQAGVYDFAESGEIFSKRMVRDECLRNKRAEGGKLGGNPSLKVNLKVIPEVKNEVKQKPTPSSSSSSSSSSSLLIPVAKATLSTAKLMTCPQEEILKLWAKHLPHLAQPRSWEGTRRANTKQRWNQASRPSAYSPDGYQTEADGIKWWDSFFGYIARDTSLSNGFETAGRTWRPDLEWVMNATNFQKIIDGKYTK